MVVLATCAMTPAGSGLLGVGAAAVVLVLAALVLVVGAVAVVVVLLLVLPQPASSIVSRQTPAAIELARVSFAMIPAGWCIDRVGKAALLVLMRLTPKISVSVFLFRLSSAYSRPVRGARPRPLIPVC
jgi:hypothetical protein